MWCAMVAVGMLLVSFSAGYAASPETIREIGVPGMESYRIDEPVFKGRAFVYETGTEHARTIMLVHGIGPGGARDYAAHIAWLARSYHVVAVDLPGFGQSDTANLVYSPTNYAAFLKHVAERFARIPFTLVGHSMGSVVSMRYAATYPNDVERLVVLDAPGVLYRYATSSHHLSRFGIDYLPSMVNPFPKIGLLARKLLGQAERTSFDPELILSSPTLRDTMLGADSSRIAALAVAIEDMSKVLPKIQAETLVIWGRNDTIAPPRTGKLLVQKIPRAQLVVIDDAAHEPMLETPARFRDELEYFLSHGWVPAPVNTAAKEKWGHGACRDQRNLVYEGDFDTLTLRGCRGIRIRNARVRKLRVEDSTVTIEDSHIGGGFVGLHARSATIEMTGGRIEGDVAIVAFGSRFDFAGIDLEGSEAAIKSPQSSSVVLSMCRVRSPYTSGDVHGYVAVTEERPL